MFSGLAEGSFAPHHSSGRREQHRQDNTPWVLQRSASHARSPAWPADSGLQPRALFHGLLPRHRPISSRTRGELAQLPSRLSDTQPRRGPPRTRSERHVLGTRIAARDPILAVRVPVWIVPRVPRRQRWQDHRCNPGLRSNRRRPVRSRRRLVPLKFGRVHPGALPGSRTNRRFLGSGAEAWQTTATSDQT